jgi:hypothetical protein
MARRNRPRSRGMLEKKKMERRGAPTTRRHKARAKASRKMNGEVQSFAEQSPPARTQLALLSQLKVPRRTQQHSIAQSLFFLQLSLPTCLVEYGAAFFKAGIPKSATTRSVGSFWLKGLKSSACRGAHASDKNIDTANSDKNIDTVYTVCFIFISYPYYLCGRKSPVPEPPVESVATVARVAANHQDTRRQPVTYCGPLEKI